MLYRFSINNTLLLLCSFVIYGSCTGCVTKDPSTIYQLSQEKFTVVGTLADSQAVRDVLSELVSNYREICAKLNVTLRSPIIVTLYTDQAALDDKGANPQMKGFRAYSGNHRIEMVSPRQPYSLPGYDTPYSFRVRLSLHEFAHIAINESNVSVPLWLNEGIACYIGPHELYSYVCQHKFPFQDIPSIGQLMTSYNSVKIADVFSFSAVEFIISKRGDSALIQLIRSPENVFGLVDANSIMDFDTKWKDYMIHHYHNNWMAPPKQALKLTE